MSFSSIIMDTSYPYTMRELGSKAPSPTHLFYPRERVAPCNCEICERGGILARVRGGRKRELPVAFVIFTVLCQYEWLLDHLIS